MRNVSGALLLGAGLLLVQAGAAGAAAITVEFGGTLNAGNTLGAYGPGSAFSGEFVYTVPQAPLAACTNNCQYVPDSFLLELGSDSATSAAGTNRIRVANDLNPPATIIDTFSVNINAGIVETFAGITITGIALQLQDNDEVAFASAALPTSFPLIGTFEIRQLIVSFQNALGQPVQAFGTLTQFGIVTATVAEPGTLLLFGAGLGLAGLLRRRHAIRL